MSYNFNIFKRVHDVIYVNTKIIGLEYCGNYEYSVPGFTKYNIIIKEDSIVILRQLYLVLFKKQAPSNLSLEDLLISIENNKIKY